MNRTVQAMNTLSMPQRWFVQRALFLWVMLGLVLAVSTAVNAVPTYSAADLAADPVSTTSSPTTSSPATAPDMASAALALTPTAFDCAYPDDCTPGTTMPDSETTTTTTDPDTDTTVPSGPMRLDCGAMILTVTGSYTYSFESFSASPPACDEVLLPVDCLSSAGLMKLGLDVFSSDLLPWTSTQAPSAALPGTYELHVFCPTQAYLLSWIVDAA